MKKKWITASLSLNAICLFVLVVFFVFRVSVDSYRSEASLSLSDQPDVYRCEFAVWETTCHHWFITREHNLAGLTFDCPTGETTIRDYGRYIDGNGIRVTVFVPKHQGKASCRVHILMRSKTVHDTQFEIEMPSKNEG
jgi:hypothetical protein